MVGRAGVEPKNASAETAKTCALPHQQRGAKSGALAPDSGLADHPPDVADLARRLAALPENVRAEIVAMLKTDEGGTR